MILDQQLLMSDAQAVTADGVTYSSSYIDLSSVKDLGAGNPLEFFCHISAPITGTSQTLTVTLQADTDSAFGTAVDVYTSKAFTEAELEAVAYTNGGYLPNMPKIPAMGSKKRYWRVKYTVANGTVAGGKITAGFTRKRPANAGVTA